MADTHGSIKVYLKVTIGLASTDLTSLIRKHVDSLTTGDLNQKITALMTVAGTHN